MTSVMRVQRRRQSKDIESQSRFDLADNSPSLILVDRRIDQSIRYRQKGKKKEKVREPRTDLEKALRLCVFGHIKEAVSLLTASRMVVSSGLPIMVLSEPLPYIGPKLNVVTKRRSYAEIGLSNEMLHVILYSQRLELVIRQALLEFAKESKLQVTFHPLFDTDRLVSFRSFPDGAGSAEWRPKLSRRIVTLIKAGTS